MGAGASTPAQTSSQAQLEVLTSIPEPVAPSLDEATAGHAAASAADEPSSTAPPPPSPPPKPLPPGRRPYAPVTMPSPEQMAQDDLMNNCAVRTGLSCVMGAGLGVAFGVFMGTMDAAGGGLDGGAGAAAAAAASARPGAPPPPPPPTQTARQAALAMARSVGARSASYAKGFAAMGALFAGAECVVEKARARHDAWNAVYAGCAAGGALASPAGAKAAAVGCASFAAFSAFIERMMDH